MSSLSDLEDKKCGESPFFFFSELGNLHDAKIKLMEWCPSRREIALYIDDLYSNFLGLPEYTEIRPAKLVLVGVDKIEANISPDDFRLRVMDFEVERTSSDSRFNVSIAFTPSGIMRVSCVGISCHSIDKEAAEEISP